MLRLAVISIAAAATAAYRPSGCNPLTTDPGASCMLPWPSDHFQARTWDSSATPSLAFLTNATFPVDDTGRPIDPVRGGWSALTGFSPAGSFLAHFPNLDPAASNLTGWWEISKSVGADCNSVIVDTTTGQPLLHWHELDHSSDSTLPEGYERASILWPAGRLNDATRYIVAFRNLVDGAGNAIQPSDGFLALRDNVTSNSPDIVASRARYEGIFATLEKLGWARSSLTLAVDFTTATREDVTGRLLSMRDDAMRRTVNGSTLQYFITSVTDSPRDGIARQVQGYFSGPSYLNDPLPIPGSALVLDPVTGLPVYQNMQNWSFTVAIPHSLANGSIPVSKGGVLQYGHGLFGDQGEVEVGYLSEWADQYGYVLIAVDEVGLTEYDEPAAIIILTTDITGFGYVPDRCQQGVVNELLATALITNGPLRNDPNLNFPAAGGSVVTSNPEMYHYYGNSQGGILGHVYMAMTQQVTRGVLGVGGGPYSLLLPRSSDFGALFDVLRLRYARPLDRIALMSVLQALWDRAEPGGYLHAISADPLPGTPAHRVVYQHGLADAQVTWLGVRYAAFSTGAVIFESNVGQGNESLAHFTSVPDSTVITSGNVMSTWSFQAPPGAVPDVNLPAAGPSDSHEKPRRQADAQAMMANFFATGQVTNTCGGPCIAPPSTSEPAEGPAAAEQRRRWSVRKD